jgi:hypothetical protein
MTAPADTRPLNVPPVNLDEIVWMVKARLYDTADALDEAKSVLPPERFEELIRLIRSLFEKHLDSLEA